MTTRHPLTSRLGARDRRSGPGKRVLPVSAGVSSSNATNSANRRTVTDLAMVRMRSGSTPRTRRQLRATSARIRIHPHAPVRPALTSRGRAAEAALLLLQFELLLDLLHQQVVSHAKAPDSLLRGPKRAASMAASRCGPDLGLPRSFGRNSRPPAPSFGRSRR